MPRLFSKSQDSSVGIATGYDLDDLGSTPGRDKKFSLLHSVQPDSGIQPASYGTGTGGDSPWIKRPGREADHSPLSNAEVKNGGAI
jgi:hypothetical protein